MTRVLVTGATGYVGSQLVRQLIGKGGYEVSVLVRPTSNLALLNAYMADLRIHQSDGTVESLTKVLQEARPAVVVHLASLFLSQHAPQDVLPLIQANIQFGTCLLEAMLQAGIRRFVNTGTAWETMDGPPVYRPVCLYAATKRAFEDILTYYEDAHGFSALTVKLYDTYGPEDPRPKLFSLLMRSLEAQEPIPFSPGEQTLDLTYIDDVTAAFERAICYLLTKNTPRPEEVHVGSGQGRPLREVVRIFEEAVGQRANIGWGERPYRAREVMRAQADLAAAEHLLGWMPTIELAEGIRRTFVPESRDR
ncbi:CDP-abequose synthase [compost metagenome]